MENEDNIKTQTFPFLERLPRTVELVRVGNAVEFVFVDQTKLPDVLDFVRTSDWQSVVRAIKTLQVRGAPALGVAGAAALTLWAAKIASVSVSNGCKNTFGSTGDAAFEAQREARDAECKEYVRTLNEVADTIAGSRPTAVNLSWGVARARNYALQLIAEGVDAHAIAEKLFVLAKHMEVEDEAINRAIGAQGATLLQPQSRILTHCNAGSLATVFYGTALGVVYTAAAQGKIAHVFADETRPVGQGARLTAWELARAGVPVTLICDNMAASLMACDSIDAVIVGADRITANGDVANKIGTYGLAVLAQHHNIPFYVAAPRSSFDVTLATGASIPIEEREAYEVLPHALEGVRVWNPAFDVTPAALITNIITEEGVFTPSDLLHLPSNKE